MVLSSLLRQVERDRKIKPITKDKLRKDFIAYFRACYQCKCLQTKTSLRMIGNKLNSYCTRWLRTVVQRLATNAPVFGSSRATPYHTSVMTFRAKNEQNDNVIG